jgi:ABC-2 type transport system permease protein
MSNYGVLTLDLSFRRRSLFWYSVGMAAYVLVVVALYPSFKDSTNLDELTSSSSGVAALFGITGSITSPTGWVSANVYANFYPLLILLLTIGYGASCIAGQEHDGHLELVMSLPFARTRVVAQKIGAMVLQATVFSVVVFLSVLAGRAFDLSLSTWDLATSTLGCVLLGIDLGLLALAVGAATGKRGESLGVASVVAAASYLVSSLAPLVSWLKPARYLSLFYWSVGDNQLENGLSLGGFAILVAVGAAIGAAAIWAFTRHDLS